MTDQSRSEVFRLRVDVDEEMLRTIRETAEAEEVDDRTVLARAVVLYGHLTRARRAGDRMWVGQAPLFAEEWTWR